MRSPLLWLLVVYYAVSALTLAVWDSRGVYSPTGDEPHYLVIADALVLDGTTEVGQAYRREIDDPRWYQMGLAEPGSPLQPPSAHVVPTEDGFHSWHGLGVGGVIAIPAQTLGIEGARWVMVAIASLGVALAWVIAGRFFPTRGLRIGATAAVAVAYPLLLAGTQIYPDVPGGVLLLAVLTWWVSPAARSSTRLTLLAGLAAALVPWLGSRFLLPGTIAVLALVWANRHGRSRLAAVALPAAISATALIAYHLTAFGNLLGPPTEGTVAFGREFLVLLPGLLLDQNQGIVWANPVLWLALIGMVVLWRRSRSVLLLWLALMASLWIPAAAHPGLYGLGSFNGRYAWPLAIMAVLPALAALGALARRAPRTAWLVIALGVAFQVYLVALSVVVGGSAPGSPAGLDLYTRPPHTWLESYSAWWFPIERLLPAWYNPEWAFGYPQNWVWLVIAIAVVVIAARGMPRRTVAVAATAVALVGVILAALLGRPGDRALVQRVDVTVTPGVDPVGYPVIGPAQLMRFGTYFWWVDYSASTDQVAGKWELVRATDDQVVAAGELIGSNGAGTRVEAPITVRDLEPRDYFLRVGWYGESDLTITATGVRFDQRIRLTSARNGQLTISHPDAGGKDGAR